MARYSSHVADGEQFADVQGTELGGIDAGRKEAARFAADLTLFKLTFFATAGRGSVHSTVGA